MAEENSWRRAWSTLSVIDQPFSTCCARGGRKAVLAGTTLMLVASSSLVAATKYRSSLRPHRSDLSTASGDYIVGNDALM